MCNLLSIKNIIIIIIKQTRLFQEFSNHETEDDGIVALAVQMRDANLGAFEELVLVAIELVGGGANVEQNDLWVAIHQPPGHVHLKQRGLV